MIKLVLCVRVEHSNSLVGGGDFVRHSEFEMEENEKVVASGSGKIPQTVATLRLLGRFSQIDK